MSDELVLKLWFDGSFLPAQKLCRWHLVAIVDDGRFTASGQLPARSAPEAEYLACEKALLWIKEQSKIFRFSKIFIYSDNLMLVNQLNGFWKIRGGFYKQHVSVCKKLFASLNQAKIEWIPREENIAHSF